MNHSKVLGRGPALLVTITLILASVALLSVPACAGSVGVTSNKIYIGSISPLTGPIAMVGVAIANGAKDYFNFINDQGGINGRRIVFIAEDGKYEPPTAIASLKKLLVRDKIFALSSTSGTPITAALGPSIKRAGLPSMCTIAAASIFEPKPPKDIFSFGPFYSENMIFNIEYILNVMKAKNPKLALFYQDDEFGQAGAEGFDKAVKKYNLKVVAREKYSRSAIDISSQVHNIKKANPDYLLITAIPSHTIMLLKEAKKMGLDIPIMGVANTRFEAVIKVVGDAAANFYTTEYTALPNEKGVPGIDKMMEIWNNNNKGKGIPSRYYILSYVNAMIMVEAMKRCGDDLNRENFRNQIESLKDFDTQGITGKISYSPDDHCPLTTMRLVKANPATNLYEPVSDWGLPKLETR
jgi:branched-chain amino acid transport system substrate-binding protein